MSFKTNAMTFLKRSQFVASRNAPSIMTYVGVGGFVATVGLAIRATSKMDEVSPKLRSQVEAVKTEIAENAETISKKDASERLAKAYIDVAKVVVRIYSPTLATGTVSILLVLGGHGMMVKRQTQLVALYTALDTSYRAYRARVREELGAEREDHIYRRPAMRALDAVETDADGNPVEGADTTQIDMGGQNPSPYARFFDPASPNWVKEAEWNLMFLRAQEKWANDRLRQYGYLFLNEVYEALGLERSQSGQMVGWKLDNDGTARPGTDGFISFGLGDIYDENARAFINGQENIALLDFNVDGIIRI